LGPLQAVTGCFCKLMRVARAPVIWHAGRPAPPIGPLTFFRRGTLSEQTRATIAGATSRSIIFPPASHFNVTGGITERPLDRFFPGKRAPSIDPARKPHRRSGRDWRKTGGDTHRRRNPGWCENSFGENGGTSAAPHTPGDQKLCLGRWFRRESETDLQPSRYPHRVPSQPRVNRPAPHPKWAHRPPRIARALWIAHCDHLRHARRNNKRTSNPPTFLMLGENAVRAAGRGAHLRGDGVVEILKIPVRRGIALHVAR